MLDHMATLFIFQGISHVVFLGTSKSAAVTLLKHQKRSFFQIVIVNAVMLC